MRRTGIIHAELARQLAALRHTDTFVICDAGLPLAPGTPCVDLGYRYGAPSFADVVAAVLPEIVVEHSWISGEMAEANPEGLGLLHAHGLVPVPVPHEEFKAGVRDARFAVRTGEATPYANVLCRAGVAF
jgi:D-ribose pyranase